MTLDVFGFRALWSPYFFIAVVLFTISYFVLTIKYRYLFKESKPLTFSQGMLFISAMILLYVIKGSPLDLMGHIMFYAHMIQMAFLYLLIPPILIVAIPAWVWQKIWSVRFLKGLFTFFTKPLLALILFNGMFSLYHMPLIFDLVKTDMWLHAAYTSVLFLFSLFMWWPLLNKIEKLQTLSGLKKVAYIFASGVLLTPACALIIFNDQPMYAAYSDPEAWMEAMQLCVPAGTLANLNINGPEMFASMSLLHDQQLGGVLMKIIQEVIYGAMLARVFYEWYRSDQKEAEEQQVSHLDPYSIK
ncbi:cytochrome c oxidase assembly factor CtaG [Bacillus benzoevorans]|uniref:Putative membrane protein n=1 Tax=Bacillus benzoevorans TaxID=1456 RepID=A0A7X0LUM1_9BACI|nr:cytochrome c oxidase assembly factor CtaG [Bacillus benzoevorans]MBB6443712.1 putative membrane protein [Bacillus benzoevorans]